MSSNIASLVHYTKTIREYKGNNRNSLKMSKVEEMTNETSHNPIIMIHMDVGGLPPIPIGSFWLFLSWTFFSSFQVLNFQSRFEALNNVFRDLYSYIVD
jgi:hypothetical protein